MSERQRRRCLDQRDVTLSRLVLACVDVNCFFRLFHLFRSNDTIHRAHGGKLGLMGDMYASCSVNTTASREINHAFLRERHQQVLQEKGKDELQSEMYAHNQPRLFIDKYELRQTGSRSKSGATRDIAGTHRILICRCSPASPPGDRKRPVRLTEGSNRVPVESSPRPVGQSNAGNSVISGETDGPKTQEAGQKVMIDCWDSEDEGAVEVEIDLYDSRRESVRHFSLGMSAHIRIGMTMTATTTLSNCLDHPPRTHLLPSPLKIR